MKSINGYFSFLLIVAFIFSQTVQAQQKSSDKDLPNFLKVSEQLYRGGQPTEEGIKKLARMGVKTIIDLRGEGDLRRKEAIWAQKAGVEFKPVPLSNWFKPKTADIEQIIKYIDAPENQPVYVHCKRGSDRTGTVIAVYRISHENCTSKQIHDEAKKFGIGWWQFWMKDYIGDYYRDFSRVNSNKDKSCSIK